MRTLFTNFLILSRSSVVGTQWFDLNRISLLGQATYAVSCHSAAYRLFPKKVVEPSGIEPLTSTLRTSRSPN